MSVLYRHALQVDGLLRDIRDVLPTTRGDGAPYSCLSCERELVAVLGNRQAHHFRHKHEHDCSSETYRHQLAKRIFVAEYERSVRERRRFDLVRGTRGTCTFYQDRFGFTCSRTEPRRHDLTKWFDRVSVEATREGFRADVLLWSEQHSEFVFVEMAVTHACEPEKVHSGIRIVEIAITSEDDALALGRPEVDARSERVRLYGFKPDPTPVGCAGDCDHPVRIFALHKSGKVAIHSIPAREVAEGSVLRRARHHEILTGEDDAQPGWLVFRRKVRETHFGVTPVHHCFMCRSHGLGLDGEGLWCKKQKRTVQRNEAIECELFRPLSTPTQCEAADRANEEFVAGVERRRVEREAAYARALLGVQSRRAGRAGAKLPPLPAPVPEAQIYWRDSDRFYELQSGGQFDPPADAPRLERIVDFYPRAEVWTRYAMQLVCWTTASGVLATLSDMLDPSALPIAAVEARDVPTLQAGAERALHIWGRTTHPGAIIDLPTGWEKPPSDGPPVVSLPMRYVWIAGLRVWQRASPHP